MAKTGTLGHRKTRRLAKELGVSQLTALGIMEAIWSEIGCAHKTGDISHLSSEDVALTIYWDGCEEELLHALVKCDVLTTNGGRGLYISGWKEHASAFIRKALTRNGQDFWEDVEPVDQSVTSHRPVSVHPKGDVDQSISTQDKTRQDKTSEDKTSSSPRFTRPTVEEIELYMSTLGIENPNVHASKWHAHYESNGWKVGRNPMRDWKAAVRTWDLPKVQPRRAFEVAT